MKKEKALKEIREMVFPIIDPRTNNQPCRTCPYWQKECAFDLDVIYTKRGYAILICVMKMRDYLKKNRRKKRDGRR